MAKCVNAFIVDDIMDLYRLSGLKLYAEKYIWGLAFSLYFT